MGLIDRLKARFIRKEVTEFFEPYDTERERRAMAEEKIKTGMSPIMANAAAFLLGVFQEAVFAVVTNKDFAALLGEPMTLFKLLLATFLFKLALRAVPPGTILVPAPQPLEKPVLFVKGPENRE